VTGPPVIAPRRLNDVAAAVQAGQVIAVPGDGGYQLAIRHTDPAALAGFESRGCCAASPFQIMVGRRAEAVQLTSEWGKETAQVTDRMWPGPLTVIVPAGADQPGTVGRDEAVMRVIMPSWRPLRALCRRSGPLAWATLCRADGQPIATADEAAVLLLDEDVALVLDGGPRRGPGPTVVDCTVSPPVVREVGALPASYVEAALMMGRRKRSWFAKG
jgi:L-threonylcarbamoyladenylate synthase